MNKSPSSEVTTIETDKWSKSFEIMHNIHESKMLELRDRMEDEKKRYTYMLTAIQYLAAYDPECKIEFMQNEDSNTFNVKFDFNPDLQPMIDSIMTTGQLQEPPKSIKLARKSKKKAS